MDPSTTEYKHFSLVQLSQQAKIFENYFYEGMIGGPEEILKFLLIQ